MTGISTIILSAGPINYAELPVGTNSSNAMIPVSGKPVIGWILDDLLSKGFASTTVVIREEDRRLRAFLERCYSRRIDVHVAAVDGSGSILHSLQAGLASAAPSSSVQVILGDTLIRDSFDAEGDYVFVGEVDDSRRWCLARIDTEQKVTGYLEKPRKAEPPYLALAGYYRFERRRDLEECLRSMLDQGKRQLSDVLDRYGQIHPVQARKADDWLDFGNIDNLVEARRRLLTPRYFNALTVNPILNTISKISDRDEKLRDELNWYLSIPDELRVLTPRLISHKEVDGRLEIVQEHYGYPTLAELYVFGELHPSTWRSVLRKVLRIQGELRKHRGTLSKAAISEMYLGKTMSRLNELREQHPGWSALLEQPEVHLNGRMLQNVSVLERSLASAAADLVQNAEICITHGDLCFSNILFDINNQIIRLIDPRGSFGEPGIFGDARYDIAKLRHSVCGLYDYIVADMFELQDSDEAIEATIYSNGTAAEVGAAFDELIVEAGFDLREIRLIEGLLFLSMVPLHRDRPRRQRMMFLTGLRLLNDVLT